MKPIRKYKGCSNCGSLTKHKRLCPIQQLINTYKSFNEFNKHNKDIYNLIPIDKLPKRITGRPKHKIDHYDFKGDYKIEILNIGNMSLPNPNNNKYYKKGGEIQE